MQIYLVIIMNDTISPYMFRAFVTWLNGIMV